MLDQKNSELSAANKLLDEKNARSAQLNETAQQFVDNVSHDFRSPLTVIKEYAGIIRDGLAGQVTADQKKFLEIINDRADDLANMVDDMLDVSRLEAGIMSVWRRKTKISDVFAHVAPILERKAGIKNVSLEILLDEKLPVAYADPEKIGRVIVNLAANAIKFCGDGKAVKLWAKPADDPTEIVIGVTDNGPGIPTENLQQIFERFKQLEWTNSGNVKGFGLGLSIAKDLVALNLGHMNVTSEPGKGSEFSFTVPVWDPEEIVARYLKQTPWSGRRPTSVAFLVATVDTSTEQSAANAVDEFLNHAFRGNDLILHVQRQKWLVLTLCQANEVVDVINRVNNNLNEYNRDIPGEKLPKVEFRHKYNWSQNNLIDDSILQVRAELAAESRESQKPLVLLVDDDHELLQGIGIRLRAAGFEVITAADGRSAVDLAVEKLPDAILLDNYMPVMSGLEALNELKRRAETAELPVIMFSASTSTRDQQKALQQGARFFLEKPCDARTFIAALREVISKPSLVEIE